jgi:hypothetical protein
MPRDGSGIYSLPAGYLAVTGEDILASQHNSPLEDIKDALTASLPRNGAAAMTGNLAMGGYSISGAATGTFSGLVTGARFTADSGAGGTCEITGSGEATRTGWIEWRRANNDRLAYCGYTLDGGNDVDFCMETAGAALSITNGGLKTAWGVQGRAGVGGAASNWVNVNWTGAYSELWIDAVNQGPLTRAGMVVGSACQETNNRQSTSTAIPFDDSLPLITEGAEVLSQAYTCLTTSNVLRFRVHVPVSLSDAHVCAVALFDGSTCIAAEGVHVGGDSMAEINIQLQYAPASTSTKTYSVRFGPGSGAVTAYTMGNDVSRAYGGAKRASLLIEEIRA